MDTSSRHDRKLLKTVSGTLTLFLKSLLDQNTLFMPQMVNVLIITWTDWQNLTKIYKGTTSEYVKNDIFLCELDLIFKVAAETNYMFM